MRITIPDLMRLAEEQTHGLLKQGDWYPVPATVPFTRFLGNLQSEEYVDLSCHPHCGMATYLIIVEDEVKPISDFINIQGLINELTNSKKTIEDKKLIGRIKTINGIIKNIKPGLLKYIYPLLNDSSYEKLSDLHHNMIMISSMHFMDPYNFDINRLKRCVIHYATPDGRIIPFCSMNTLHRHQIESKFAKELKELTPLYNIKKLKNKIKNNN
jgi:uncharacterized radical SAM superfamily Fe-S cluster-containing enzyme